MRPAPLLDRYRPADRARLYEVCRRTGRAGEDATAEHDDPDLLGHVYLGAYLELAPDLAVVARPADAAAPLGYLVGTQDTEGFERACAQYWWPALRRRYPAEQPYRPADAALVHRIHHPSRTTAPWLAEYPGHLHVNLLPEARGAGAGRALVEWFAAELRARGVPGLHLGVAAANARAIAFYRHLGMVELARDHAGLVLGMALTG